MQNRRKKRYTNFVLNLIRSARQEFIDTLLADTPFNVETLKQVAKNFNVYIKDEDFIPSKKVTEAILTNYRNKLMELAKGETQDIEKNLQQELQKDELLAHIYAIALKKEKWRQLAQSYVVDDFYVRFLETDFGRYVDLKAWPQLTTEWEQLDFERLEQKYAHVEIGNVVGKNKLELLVLFLSEEDFLELRTLIQNDQLRKRVDDSKSPITPGKMTVQLSGAADESNKVTFHNDVKSDDSPKEVKKSKGN